VKQLMVEAAAILGTDGVVYTLPRPAKHRTIRAKCAEQGHPIGGTSGFLLSDGTFATRAEALPVAIQANQLKKIPKTLHSGHMW
jgi:hypothetical protein